jgi:predicted small metal-binding protein
MAYTLACRDTGIDCSHISRGETMEELWEDGVKHVKEVHGYTDEQVNDPKFKEEMKAFIKQT